MQSGGRRRRICRSRSRKLGLGYRLMTQFTSFVAVEETTVTEAACRAAWKSRSRCRKA